MVLHVRDEGEQRAATELTIVREHWSRVSPLLRPWDPDMHAEESRLASTVPLEELIYRA